MNKLVDFIDDLFWKKLSIFSVGRIVFRISKEWSDYDYISYEIEDIIGTKVFLVKTDNRNEKLELQKKDLTIKNISGKEVLVFSL